ncbi:MAG: indole-3-glycerol-phosphate synthase TrpC, partial [Bacteroidales bacterium]|nr:indole-3-glycerol-phosphate synthase TrpC [Bacteroidales bacterium]
MAPLIKGRFRALGVSRPVMISESGISSPETVRQLRKEGFRGFLMGENFMKREDPGKALKEFISEL